MVCWQQAKMLYKYKGSLHTRTHTHTPPDEQNQSSGTAELRVYPYYSRSVSCRDRCPILLSHLSPNELESTVHEAVQVASASQFGMGMVRRLTSLHWHTLAGPV